MGKFSTQVENLKEQTDLLREKLTQVTGVNCYNKSIGQCALVAAQNMEYNEDIKTIPESDLRYIRPNWYPDIKNILNQAIPLTVGTTTYYPAYIILTRDNTVKQTLYTSASTSNNAVNFMNSTGCSVYLFSDVVNNDINNQSSELLEITTTSSLTHIWDTTKDISNPDRPQEKVRWFIAYVTDTKKEFTIQPGATGYIELITGNCTIKSNSFLGSYMGNWEGYRSSIKYIEMQDSTSFTVLSSSIDSCAPFGMYSNLEEVIFPPSLTKITETKAYGTCFQGALSLKRVSFPNLQEISTGIFANCISLKHVDFPNTLVKIQAGSFFTACRNIRDVIIPDSVTFFKTTGNTFYECSNLVNVQFPDHLTDIELGSAFYNCNKLKSIVFPSALKFLKASSLCNNCYKLERVIIPNNLEEFNIGSLAQSCPNLKEDILPEYVKTLYLNTVYNAHTHLSYARFPRHDIYTNTTISILTTSYIELYADYDISNSIFGSDKSGYLLGSYLSAQWVKDLCSWLRDRTNETANTIKVGNTNIEKLENIYLTFNPNNKRDIQFDDITAETEGAISILEFITNQLNWTVS